MSDDNLTSDERYAHQAQHATPDDARDREWNLVQLASDYWNAHYVPGDVNPVQIGVPQLVEFAQLAAEHLALPKPTLAELSARHRENVMNHLREGWER